MLHNEPNLDYLFKGLGISLGRKDIYSSNLDIRQMQYYKGNPKSLFSERGESHTDCPTSAPTHPDSSFTSPPLYPRVSPIKLLSISLVCLDFHISAPFFPPALPFAQHNSLPPLPIWGYLMNIPILDSNGILWMHKLVPYLQPHKDLYLVDMDVDWHHYYVLHSNFAHSSPVTHKRTLVQPILDLGGRAQVKSDYF